MVFNLGYAAITCLLSFNVPQYTIILIYMASLFKLYNFPLNWIIIFAIYCNIISITNNSRLSHITDSCHNINNKPISIQDHRALLSKGKELKKRDLQLFRTWWILHTFFFFVYFTLKYIYQTFLLMPDNVSKHS